MKLPSKGKVSVGHPVDVASGTLFHMFDDFAGPGRVSLAFGRRYSTSLLDVPPGMFGRGWSSPFEMRLRRNLEGYEMVPASGEGVVGWYDRKGRVEHGETVTNPGAFCDLTRVGDRYDVVQWDPDSESVTHYFFAVRDYGRWMPLVERCDAESEGLTVSHDDSGRVVRISQKREGRLLELEYDVVDRVVSVALLCPGPDMAAASAKMRGSQGSQQQHAEEYRRTVCRYEYDEAGFLRGFRNALGHGSSYEYDGAGRMTREVNSSGMEYRFQHDASGRCIDTRGVGDYGLTSLEFNEHARLTRVTNSLGNVTSYLWNESGQVIERVTPLGNKWRTEFDEFGRVIAEGSPGGAETRFEYDEAGNRSGIISPTGAATSMTYNRQHQLTSLIDGEGNLWTQEYDTVGRLISAGTPDGREINYTYDGGGDLLSVSGPSGGDYRFDRSGNLIERIDSEGNIIAFSYDVEGWVVGETLGASRWMHYSRDKLGRVLGATLVDGTEVSFEHNAYGQLTRLTAGNLQDTRWAYSASGELLAVESSTGVKLRFEYGTVPGRMLSATNETDEKWQLEYDGDGNVVSEIDFAGNRREYAYDASGDLAATTDDEDGRIEFEADGLGQVVAVLQAGVSEIRYKYDQRGLLLRADNGDFRVEREYDDLGQLLVERQGEYEVEFSSDPDSGATVLRSSLGYESYRFRNSRGLVNTMATPFHPPIGFLYDSGGRRTVKFIPDSIIVGHSLDLRGRPQEQLVLSSARAPDTQVVISRTYEYGAQGYPTLTVDSRIRESRYTYDRSGRIVAARLPGGREESFSYDALGNCTFSATPVDGRTSQFLEGDNNAVSCDYDPGSRLRQRGTARYEHNFRGELVSMTRRVRGAGATTKDETTLFHWDLAGQLCGVTTADENVWKYEYDALGRRVRKIGPDVRFDFVWEGDRVLHEIRHLSAGKHEQSATRIRTFEYEPDSFIPLAMIIDGDRFLCVNDIAGNPRELISVEGAVVWSAVYSTWGRVWAAGDDALACPIRFQGQWYDDETGLHYNRFRYYDPETGRYLSPDPIGLTSGSNAYAYAPNTLAWRDVFGLANHKCGEIPEMLQPFFEGWGSSAILFRIFHKGFYKRSQMKAQHAEFMRLLIDHSGDFFKPQNGVLSTEAFYRGYANAVLSYRFKSIFGRVSSLGELKALLPKHAQAKLRGMPTDFDWRMLFEFTLGPPVAAGAKPRKGTIRAHPPEASKLQTAAAAGETYKDTPTVSVVGPAGRLITPTTVPAPGGSPGQTKVVGIPVKIKNNTPETVRAAAHHDVTLAKSHESVGAAISNPTQWKIDTSRLPAPGTGQRLSPMTPAQQKTARDAWQKRQQSGASGS